MRDHAHPISSTFRKRINGADIEPETDFLLIDATSEGALPVRSREGLHFPFGRHKFHATGAEVREALTLGLLKIHRIDYTITATERVHFRTFINHFFNLRQAADLAGDVMLKLFYKLVMNSSYGKFAQNPEDYENLLALPAGERPEGDLINDPEIEAIELHDDLPTGEACKCDGCFRRRNAWRLTADLGEVYIWGRPTPNARQSYLNVATAASITAYSRVKLMQGLAGATRPYYCDTDSIICEALSCVPLGDDLGQWSFEAEGHTLAIAGKKQYALFGPIPDDPKKAEKRIKAYGSADVIKLASKGVRLTGNQIRTIAEGGRLTYTQDAPMFKMDGRQKTLTRNIKNTARVERMALV